MKIRREEGTVIMWDKADLLKNIKDKIDELTNLNNCWQAQVDPALAQQTRIANYRDNCLVIEVKSNTWLTRLHYQRPSLVALLKQSVPFSNLKELKLYVNREPYLPKVLPRRVQSQISENTRQLLSQSATLIKYRVLGDALKRLAERAR